MTYLKMLEEEIAASDAFTQENFGLAIGDGFPEMVRELLKSDKLVDTLIISFITANMSHHKVAELLQEMKRVDGKVDYGRLIMRNLKAFETTLAMLYWGVQMGRRMEREAAQQLARMSEGAK
jgi:hypothetical protein